MTPFEIFARNGHLPQPGSADRSTPRAHAAVDEVLARQAFASVNTVERWVRRVFPG